MKENSELFLIAAVLAFILLLWKDRNKENKS